MGRFILGRIIQGLIVIFGVTLIVFVVTRMVGDPVKVMLPLESTLEQRAAFEKQLGKAPRLSVCRNSLSPAISARLWKRSFLN